MRITKTSKTTWKIQADESMTDFWYFISTRDCIHGGLDDTPANVELEDHGFTIRIVWPVGAGWDFQEMKTRTARAYKATKKIHKAKLGWIPR